MSRATASIISSHWPPKYLEDTLLGKAGLHAGYSALRAATYVRRKSLEVLKYKNVLRAFTPTKLVENIGQSTAGQMEI